MPPPQFASLLTASTDFTCGGTVPCSSWPMPALPATGGSFVDSTFGTTQYRLAKRTGATGLNIMPQYSRVQSWNSDGTKLMMCDGDASTTLLVYDATTTPPTPLYSVAPSPLPSCGDTDWFWANTNPNLMYYVPASITGHGMELHSVDISACVNGTSCAGTNTLVHNFADFTNGKCTSDSSDPDGAGHQATKLETGSGAQGGFLSSDDRFFSATCDFQGTGGRHNIDIIYYDRVLDTVLTQTKWYNLCAGGTKFGCLVTDSVSTTLGTAVSSTGVHTVTPASMQGIQVNFPLTINSGQSDQEVVLPTAITGTTFTANFAQTHANTATISISFPGNAGLTADWMRMSMHPNGSYITIIWQCHSYTNTDASAARGCGTEVFDSNFTFLGWASSQIAHQDLGYDVSGVPIFVGVGTARGDVKDERGIEMTNLTTLSTTAVNSKRILLPCSYSRTAGCESGVSLQDKLGASHISMNGAQVSNGSARGYGLVSTMMQAGPQIPRQVDFPLPTTLGTAVGAAGSATVTPGSMANIATGYTLLVGFGTGNVEAVTVTGVTATTFTATFANTHGSSEAVGTLSTGDTGFGAEELFAMKFDVTAVDDSSATVYRIARNMGMRDACFNAEPHATANRDFTQVAWGSTWNSNGAESNCGGSGGPTPVYGFWLKLANSGASTPISFTGAATLRGSVKIV